MIIVKNIETDEEVIIYDIVEKNYPVLFLVYKDGRWTYDLSNYYRPLTKEEAALYNMRMANVQFSGMMDRFKEEFPMG